MEEPQLTYRISWLTGSLIVSIAVVADLAQVLFSLTAFLAPASDIATVLAEGFIFVFFFFRGVRFLSGKKALSRTLSFFGETVIEMVPFVDALPLLTLATIYQIHTARAEDTLDFQERHSAWEAAAKREIEQEQYAAAVYEREMGRVQANFRASQQDAEELENA
jgi:hypothetical protein